jgi:hypothetical protein
LTAVHLETKGQGFDLVRQDQSGWILPQQSNYPVAFDRIRTLLTGLAGLTAVEPRTRRADRYHYLGVEDPSPTTTNMHVVVKAGNDTLADVIVGKYDSSLGPNNAPRAFVRLAGDPQSWLAQADLRLNQDPLEWLDRDLVAVAPDRISSVTVEQPDGSYRIARSNPGDPFVLDGIDPAKEITHRAGASALGEAISALSFDQVQTADRLPPDAKTKSTAIYRTFDGLVVTLTDHERDGGDWVSVSAAFDPQAAAAGAKLANPAGADGSKLLKDAAAVKAAAEALSAKAKGWIYLLTPAKALELGPKRATLVEAKEAPAANAPAPAADASHAPLPVMNVPADGPPTPVPGGQ